MPSTRLTTAWRIWATKPKMTVIIGASGLLHDGGYGSILRRTRGDGCRSPVTESVRVVTSLRTNLDRGRWLLSSFDTYGEWLWRPVLRATKGAFHLRGAEVEQA